jgi:hypothetical protein
VQITTRETRNHAAILNDITATSKNRAQNMPTQAPFKAS